MKMEVFLLSGGESPICGRIKYRSAMRPLRSTKPRTGVNALKQATGRGKMLIGESKTYGAGALRSFPHQHHGDSQPIGRGWGFAGGLRNAAGGEQHCHLALTVK